MFRSREVQAPGGEGGGRDVPRRGGHHHHLRHQLHGLRDRGELLSARPPVILHVCQYWHPHYILLPGKKNEEMLKSGPFLSGVKKSGAAF